MPGQGKTQLDNDATFTDFMSAFRTEMRDARTADVRTQKFLPSAHLVQQQQAQLEQRANEIFGVGADLDPGFTNEGLMMGDDFDEWPDEFLLLGVAEQDAVDGSTSPSPESETSTTSETASTEDEEDNEEDDDDAWPIEMLIG